MEWGELSEGARQPLGHFLPQETGMAFGTRQTGPEPLPAGLIYS